MTDSILKDYFQNTIQVAPSTEENYRYHFRNYEKATGYTLKELVEEAENEEDKSIRPRNRKIKQHLQDFKDYLTGQGFSPSHISLAVSVVRTFYKDMEIDLPYTRRQRTRPEDPGSTEDLPGREDILLALENTTHKYKAIILLMASSGMGRAEVLNLTVQDFLDSIQKYTRNPINLPLDIGEITQRVTGQRGVVAKWKVTRQKTGFQYFTFSSPESIVAILRYLEKYPPTSLDEPIIKGVYPEPMSLNSLNAYFNELNKKCKFGRNGRQAYFRSHNIRKFFTNMMYKAGIPQLSIDFMLGHRVQNKVTEAYFKPDPGTLYQHYLRALPYVTITEKVTVRDITTEDKERFEEMEKKLEEMEKKEALMDEMLKSMMEKQLKKEQ